MNSHSFAVYLMICIYTLLEGEGYMCVNIARSTSESYLNFKKWCVYDEEFHENEVGKAEVNTRVDKIK